MSTAEFYDGLADSYHALYPDWAGEGRAQAEALHRLLGRWHRGPADIADIACGIGTQLIGLAGLGHRIGPTRAPPSANSQPSPASRTSGGTCPSTPTCSSPS